MFSSASASPLGGLGGLGASWNLSTIMKTSGITADVQQHLARVYATLAGCVLSAALAAGAVLLLGSRVDPSGWMGMLSFMVTMGGTIWLHSEPVHNHQKRVGILMAVAASLGVTTSSLIAIALDMDPSILVSAFLLTTMVFLCFTASALLATRRSYLFLGGILGSMLSALLVLNLVNLFFRSSVLMSASLYGGLFMFCGYVVFDTQMIIEKASMGDKDYLKHTLELFLDFVSIFIRILVILIQNADKKERSERNDRRSNRR